MKNVTLKEMFDILVNCIINDKDYPIFYYRREWETGHPEYIEIAEVDLIRGRFVTIDDDFSEYEWELKKSNIYMEEK